MTEHIGTGRCARTKMGTADETKKKIKEVRTKSKRIDDSFACPNIFVSFWGFPTQIIYVFIPEPLTLWSHRLF